MSKTYKGYYRPKYPEKYRGDASQIIYRSSWELKCCNYFDRNPNILEWSSEEVIIPYVSPIDNKYHRYYPDFRIVVKKKDGTKQTILIEVKPYKETQPPKQQSVKSKRFLQEVRTYGVNTAKWTAAQHYCKDRKWEFQILTEKELAIK